MKKNKLIVIFNWILLFSLPIMLLTVNVEKDKISSKILTRELSTSIINSDFNKDIINNDKIKFENNLDEEIVLGEIDKNESNSKDIVQEEENENITEEEKYEQVFEDKTNTMKTYKGKMSYYNANCKGCSGVTSTGTDISDGKIYYYDSEFGNVRIIAAGIEIKKWSIVKLKNTSLGSDVLAIVLDRGGAIGEGKTFLIDMLTNHQENKGGVENNIIVEVVREGK